MHKTFWKRSPLSSLPLPLFGLRSNNREGAQPYPSTENWIKNLLSMAPPIRTRPSFPHSQSLPSESIPKASYPYPSEGRKNGNHNHRKLIKLIHWITALSTSMKPWAKLCRATQDAWVIVESSDKRGPLEKGMANHFSILALRTPWTVWKGKMIGNWHWKMNSPCQQMPNMLQEKTWETIPERMKRQSQNENTARLWMWLVREVKSDAVKNNIA